MSLSHSVSVVIPCFNAARFLSETIQSVFAQTVLPKEILIIDDGSTDDSRRIAESFGGSVRVIVQNNQGESVARNRGIEEAQGEWIAFLDADDLWEPVKLQRQLELLNRDSTAKFCFTGYRLFGAVERLAPVPAAQAAGDFCQPSQFFRYSFCPSTALVHRDLTVRFPTWTRYGEDRLYFLECAYRYQGQLRFLPDALTRYRKHPGQQTQRPELVARGVQAFLFWLDTTDCLDESVRSEGRFAATAFLSDYLEGLKWKRDWGRYWQLRGLLQEIDPLPETNPHLRERIFPRWIYYIKDLLDRMSVLMLRRQAIAR